LLFFVSKSKLITGKDIPLLEKLGSITAKDRIRL